VNIPQISHGAAVPFHTWSDEAAPGMITRDVFAIGNLYGKELR
jgi:hypothetical protein